MEKKEILEVVKKMHVSWSTAFENPTLTSLFINDCGSGFCYWLSWQIRPSYKKCILEELSKDCDAENTWTWDTHWYPVANGKQQQQYTEVLQPRIDHLNRTITRLENEFNTQV